MVALDSKNNFVTYKFVAPDGGWGYVIVVTYAFMFVSSVTPLSVTGLIFADLLEEIGDKITKLSIMNLVMVSCIFFTGLLVNHLLSRLSVRKVATIGASIYFAGAFLAAFVRTFPQLILTYSIMQGFGYGLFLPISQIMFHAYFDKKKNVMMSLSQSLIQASATVVPFVIKLALEKYGSRAAQVLLAGFGLNLFVVALSFQPVKWHMKKVPVEEMDNCAENSKVLQSDLKETVLKPNDNEDVLNLEEEYMIKKNDVEIDKLNENTKSNSFWKKFIESLNLPLLKDPVYVIISTGLALGFVGDVTFLVLLPAIFKDIGFNIGRIANLMTICLASTFTGTLILSAFNMRFKVKSKYFFLLASFVLIIIRTVFLWSYTYTWHIFLVICLGLMRSLILVSLPLVLAEAYPNNFTAALSLSMVISGVVCLLMGGLIALVKYETQNDNMVPHLLSLANLICVVSWTIEIFCLKSNPPNVNKKNSIKI